MNDEEETVGRDALIAPPPVKWCQRQDSCPVLLAAIEAKVEAESMARTAKHNLDAATQAFETKRTLFNEFYKLAVQCRKAQQQYFADRTQAALIASKQAERQLDAHIAMLTKSSSRSAHYQPTFSFAGVAG